VTGFRSTAVCSSDEGFRAIGHGEDGAVWLRGARITGQLSLRGAELANDDAFVLDLEDAEAKHIFLAGHADWVTAVAAATLPDGRWLIVSGGEDTTIRRWDLETGQAFGDPLTGHRGWIRALAPRVRRRAGQ
jgi:WD40 repeat protein